MTISRICIVGPGAIGGMMAVKMIKAGFDVSALVRPARVEAMGAAGITLHDGDDILHATPKVASTADALGLQDLVILTVKETALKDVAPSIGPLLDVNTPVVQIMNGIPWWFFEAFDGPLQGTQLDSVDRDGCVSRHFDVNRYIGGVINCGVSWRDDGALSHDHSNQLYLGRPDNNRDGTEDIASVFRSAGYNTDIAESIHQQVMSKLLANISFNPVSALTMATIDRLLDDELVSDTLIGLMNEGRAVTKALRLDPGPDPAARPKGGAKLKASKTSMLQDMERGKPIEIDSILASVIEVAGLLDVPVPLARTVYGLLRVRQQTALAVRA
ncbi:MAG: 2-dehydropantoate 2-reductase [Rhodospirillaceae bacterium]|nr:2-dehydropantoate 2-reductase [Rhodospirillaceae bacterium]MBT6961849.1 2-dehydropantoate 2-reductase [Rhodospirillaceae bacterium]